MSNSLDLGDVLLLLSQLSLAIWELVNSGMQGYVRLNTRTFNK